MKKGKAGSGVEDLALDFRQTKFWRSPRRRGAFRVWMVWVPRQLHGHGGTRVTIRRDQSHSIVSGWRADASGPRRSWRSSSSVLCAVETDSSFHQAFLTGQVAGTAGLARLAKVARPTYFADLALLLGLILWTGAGELAAFTGGGHWRGAFPSGRRRIRPLAWWSVIDDQITALPSSISASGRSGGPQTFIFHVAEAFVVRFTAY